MHILAAIDVAVREYINQHNILFRRLVSNLDNMQQIPENSMETVLLEVGKNSILSEKKTNSLFY